MNADNFLPKNKKAGDMKIIYLTPLPEQNEYYETPLLYGEQWKSKNIPRWDFYMKKLVNNMKLVRQRLWNKLITGIHPLMELGS